MKKTIAIDFDGAIRSNPTSWKGATVIDDPPIPGIRESIESIRSAGYEVAIVSYRCEHPRGKDAIREYLNKYDIVVDDILAIKPRVVCYIDSHALTFDGNPETLLKKVKEFKFWTDHYNKRSDLKTVVCTTRGRNT